MTAVLVIADYDARIHAVQDATRLLFAMQDRPDERERTVPYLPSGPRWQPLDRFEVVEPCAGLCTAGRSGTAAGARRLARFLLGIEDEPQQAADTDVPS
jgi:hypothetical protein